MSLPWKYSSAKARARLAPSIAQGVAVCSKCGRPVVEGQAWDVDHLIGQDVAPDLVHDPDNWAVAHRRCNRSAGASYVNRKRAAAVVRPRPSRLW